MRKNFPGKPLVLPHGGNLAVFGCHFSIGQACRGCPGLSVNYIIHLSGRGWMALFLYRTYPLELRVSLKNYKKGMLFLEESNMQNYLSLALQTI